MSYEKEKGDKNILKRIGYFFGLHYKPNRMTFVLLGMLPFLMIGWFYITSMNQRKAENPKDKLLPSWSQMVEQVTPYVTEVNKRKEVNLFLDDTGASLSRLLKGVVIASFIALILGVSMGVFGWFKALGLPLIVFLSIIPPLSILPILFIMIGVDELAKISLIVIGITFLMTRDMVRAVENLPKEQMVKTLTLGGNSISYVWKIVIPQIMPKFFESIMIYLSPAWLFLIASEAVAATNGLAYRIYLSQRYMNMALIIPIVLWITFLAVGMNLLIMLFNRLVYRWYYLGRG